MSFVIRARWGASHEPVPPHPIKWMVMSLITGSSIERAYSASLFNTGSFIEEEDVKFGDFFRDDLFFAKFFFFDVCFVIIYFSFAVVGIPNFFGQFEYHRCWHVPVVAIHTHTDADLGFLVHFPDHREDPETLFVFVVGAAEEWVY